MDQLQQFVQRGKIYTYALLVLSNALLVGVWWIASEVLTLPSVAVVLSLVLCGLTIPLLIVHLVSTIFIQPLRFVWQAVLYIAPETSSVNAPELHNIKYARELVTNLVNHIYQLADVGKQVSETASSETGDLRANFVANSLPLPLAVLDKDETILFANKSFLDYIEAKEEDAVGQSVYSRLDLAFDNDHTFDAWLESTKEKSVTEIQTWERVKLTLPNEGQPKTKLFDLAAYYNKENPNGYETMLVLFDHTKAYSQDDQAVSFVALAVHELRTPLTMLRGYIEALEEDLDSTLNKELRGFLQKTQAAAGQLATFVNNILNVARVEDDQMVLKLQEENWQDVLTTTIEELRLRAEVRGITISSSIAKDLPNVGLDRVCIYEVVSNLIDNAIKYSGSGKEITITSQLSKDGFIETTIQDQGVGIPESAIPHVFDKFYRDHHNRSQIGGTGLGLFLCKTFVKAHGGNIWVQSKEGEGSTFGFTLVPYKNLAEDLKTNNNEGITTNAHGWIKNHSMYRR